MTSPSPRKPRTTPRSTPAAKFSAALLGVACLAVPAAGQDAASGAKAAAAKTDRGASILNRLRRRDPAAALRATPARPATQGRWRKAGTPATPAVPGRLRPPVEAIPVARRQDDAGRPAEDGMTEAADDLGLDLDDLDLDDLDLDDLDLDDLDLPDDLKLDLNGDATDGGGGEKGMLTPKATERVRRVRDLKGIGEILPFGDYDPNPDPEDPCRNLCPRPLGCPPADAGRGGDGDGGNADGVTDTAAYCPPVRPLSDEPFVPRAANPLAYRWAASNIAYNPLYFEDVSLERYGHNYGIFQPAVSAGKFTTQLIGLPYQMAIDHPHKCVSPLGYYRPGDCAPKLHYQIPFNLRAAVVQAAAVSGVAAVIP